jgi:multimeric flavodoxin WrbA
MKITCLLGSPRMNGNCSVLLKKFQDSARVFGAEARYYALRDLNYRGCLGCLACKTKSEGCVIQDDLTPVLESVRAADVLAMATPVYFREMTALLRAFIERTYSFFLPDFHTNPNPSRLRPGKKLVFIQVQGQADDKLFGDIFPRIEPLFQRYGYSEMHVARICGVRKIGDVEGVNGALALMEDISERLIIGKPGGTRRELLSPLVSYKITIQNW